MELRSSARWRVAPGTVNPPKDNLKAAGDFSVADDPAVGVTLQRPLVFQDLLIRQGGGNAIQAQLFPDMQTRRLTWTGKFSQYLSRFLDRFLGRFKSRANPEEGCPLQAWRT